MAAANRWRGARGADFSDGVRLVLERAGALWLAEGADPKPTLCLRHLIKAAVSVGRAPAGTETALGALVDVVGSLSTRPIEPAPPPAGDDADLATLPLSPAAQQVLTAARALCDRTTAVQTNSEPRSQRIGARNLVAALVAAPDAHHRLGPLERVWRSAFGITLDELRSRIAASFDGFREVEPERAVWDQVFGTVRLGTAAFRPDEPDSGDALGPRADAHRLAELACLKANAPPLAIGIFGDWSAGKSTFLRLMEEEIDAIAARWGNERTTPFVTRVAQISFNAWVQSGGDLWVALADRIFEGLEQHAAASRHAFRFDRSLELVAAFNLSGELTRRIHELKTAKTESKRWAEEVAKARKELVQLEKERQEALCKAAEGAVTRLAEDVRRALRNLAQECAGEVEALA